AHAVADRVASRDEPDARVAAARPHAGATPGCDGSRRAPRAGGPPGPRGVRRSGTGLGLRVAVRAWARVAEGLFPGAEALVGDPVRAATLTPPVRPEAEGVALGEVVGRERHV